MWVVSKDYLPNVKTEETPQLEPMGLTLISASPSVYARKVRLALIEKGIPYKLQNEVPWDSSTSTPQYNPLEKLPILLLEDGTAIYESSHILEYISQKLPGVAIMPPDVDDALQAKQIQVIADGMMDATSLLFFEKQRESPSEEWIARQTRKINGGLKKLDELVRNSDSSDFLVGGELSVADLAVGSLLGAYEIMQMRPFKDEYPALAAYWTTLEERTSFRETRPFMFEIKDKIV